MKDNTTLAYERRIAANAEKAKRLAAEAKALQKESQKLKRSARTHHLCNLGAMLETFLKEPDILEEDDVQQFLMWQAIITTQHAGELRLADGRSFIHKRGERLCICS